MGSRIKPGIVLSGVNLTAMGPLAIYRDAIASLARRYSDRYEITALVHRADLFSTENVRYIEFPTVKSSWRRRLWFEYVECRKLSKQLDPYLWLSMHDITPNVQTKVQAVYCHNPAAFYDFSLREMMADWKFGLFTLLYHQLYRINFKRNQMVVVQQEWVREQFERKYGAKNVVVAHPDVDQIAQWVGSAAAAPPPANEKFTMFYPAYPRTFKNYEVLFEAARLLEADGFDRFEIWITAEPNENRYSQEMSRRYGDVRSVKWIGLLTREQVLERYPRADCLAFPSKLETWGLPITEFKATGRPMMVADLPYAHETVGDYESVAFFPPADARELARLIRSAASGDKIFRPVTAVPIAAPFARNWDELWSLMLEPGSGGAPVTEGSKGRSEYAWR